MKPLNVPDKNRTLVSSFLLGFWLAAYFACCYFIYKYSYQFGLKRAAILAGLGFLFWGFPRLWDRFDLKRNYNGWWIVLGIGGVVFTLGLNTIESVRSIYFSRDLITLPSDQSLAVQSSLHLLKIHQTPYGTDTFISPHDLLFHAENIRNHPDCFDPPLTSDEVNNPIPQQLAPRIKSNLECQELQRESKSMGLRYGPVMLLFYSPFLELMGPMGILVSHALLFIGLTVLLIYYGRKHAFSLFGLSLLLIMSMLPPDFKWCNLNQGHTDLLPTVLILGGLFLWRDKRPSLLGAFLIGLSIATKSIPGLLYAPLFLRNRKEFTVMAGTVLLAYSPFLVWDFKGVIYNVAYPFFTRYEDSTSLAYYLSDNAHRVVKVFLAGLVAWMFRNLVRWDWTFKATLNFLLIAHVGAFLSGSVFHSNYMVFFYPLLALIVVHTLEN